MAHERSALLLWLLVLVFSFTSAMASRAENPRSVGLTPEERAWLDAHASESVLFFNTSFPPIEFVSDQGTFAGMGADVMALVEQRLGVVFPKQASDDWNRHLAALESGACAIAPTIVRTAERERYAFFTTPYAVVPVVIITAEAFVGGKRLEDLEGRRVAVVAGYATQTYLGQDASGRFEVVSMPDVPQGLQAVSFGQVDAFVENLAVAAYYIQKKGIPNLRVAGNTDYAFEWRIGVSRNYPLLHSAIQKALDTITESDIEAIRNRWISLDIGEWLDPNARRLLRIINAIVAVVMAGLLIVSYFLMRRLKEKVANLKMAQQALLEQGELLKMATAATQAGIWDYYPARRVVYLSRQWFGMLGYDAVGREETVEELQSYMHPEDRPMVDHHYRDYIAARGREPFEMEFRFRQANGSWCWVLSKGRAVEWDPDGVPLRLIGLDTNIQTLKDAQAGMAQSEALFRAIFDHAPYAITINNPEDGRYLAANQAFLSDRGIGQDELSNFKTSDFADIGDEETGKVVDTLRKQGFVKNLETTIRRLDGSQSHIMFSSVLLDVGGHQQVLSMTVDITEKKRAEKALKESEARFRSLFMMAPLPLIEIATDGRIVELNERFIQTLGYGLGEIGTVDDFLSVAFPDSDYRRKVASDLRQAVDQELASRSNIATGEYQVTCKDAAVRQMLIGASLIGESYLVSFVDVTDWKRAEVERQKLQEQLLQVQKLEAVGVLAGGVAHDFNNMLGAIIGYTELVMDGTDAGDPIRQNLAKILDVAQRSANLTRQLLAFARKQRVEPVRFDLNESVEAVLKMLRRLIGEDIELTWMPGKGRFTVYMDPTQFDQILANLCVNARDAIADVGKITIQTASVSLDGAFCEPHPDCVAGDYVRLSVKDNGSGIDQETIPHIFEPFFTTKGVGQGTGLGLAMVYGIVKQNSGFIRVESEPGWGTTFNIYLPQQAVAAAAEQETDSEEIPHGRGETILMVEDDPTIREIGQMMLQRLRYTVLPAPTPGDAIRLVEEKGAELDLLITDVVMPEMNGRELTQRLLSMRPGLKYIYMSGYTADVVVNRGVSDDKDHFIQKPFSLRELAVKIRAVLDQR